MRNPNDLVRWLDCFNRKERFWLLREAIGPGFSNLSEEFRKKLFNALPTGVPDIPANAWWAFDYHLDWIAVALYCFANNRPLPTASAEALGCALADGPMGPFVRVGAMGQTSVPGVFAAGDVARAAPNISFAIGDGAQAGVAAHASLLFPAFVAPLEIAA